MTIARFIAPCLLSLSLCTVAVEAASPLIPPSGYYAPVPQQQKQGQADACPATPAPYTGKLVFRSKYEGSDKARTTLNRKAERAFREQTANITELERGVSQQVMRYMRDGRPQHLSCVLGWLNSWAEADALLSTEFNHTGKSMRKWALGSMAGAYLRLKFSTSQPLARYPEQTQRIEAWFVRLAEQTVDDWSGLPLKKINNHSYWAAWSVMAAAVISDRRDLFDWSVAQFRVAAGQVDEQGYLPNELKRRQRALAYHNYSLPPLTMIAAFAQANALDLRDENQGALQRLAERVMAGVEEQDIFDDKTDHEQDMEDLGKPAKFAWLAPYCTLYACSPAAQKRQKDMGPFRTFRLGGDVSQVFTPLAKDDS
jgi:poly(beta-D-mannuronate) lyase